MKSLLCQLLSVALCVLSMSTHAQSPPSSSIIFDMDTIRHRPGEATDRDKEKVPIGSIALVEGKFGQAVQFTFAPDLGAGFMTAPVKPTPDWDGAAGFSFYVKGDGSANWAGLELIDRDDFGLRYAYCFPLDSSDWRNITVPWRDLIPELAAPLIGPAGYTPSRFGNFWFGKWFYWRDYPAHSFVIDQVALESTIPNDPAPKNPWETSRQKLQAKLAAKQSITLVTMGDSLTDKRHWANREVLWAESLAQQLKTKYSSEVTLINPAIGGTTLSQNLVVMPRWTREHPAPDLVTIWFGGNDWDSGVRGPRFKDYLSLAVGRIRRQTTSKPGILLLTTCPAHARWRTYQELEQAARDVAVEMDVGLADIAADFHHLPNADEALKQEYWAWDKVHLGPKGHALAAAAVLRALETEGDSSKVK